MKRVLDTHVFLWYITADPKLPATFRAVSQDSVNEVFLSVVSAGKRSSSTSFVSPERATA